MNNILTETITMREESLGKEHSMWGRKQGNWILQYDAPAFFIKGK